MFTRRGKLVAVAAAIGLVAVLAACSSGASAEPAKRTIYLAAVEPKGGEVVAKEPFPTAALPPGGGYALKAPNADGRWEVETYRWNPGSVVVNKGDDVTLEFIGINGKEHSAVLEGYNLNFNVRRGQITRVNFKADKAGIFNIVCGVHQPSMNAQLVVLSK